MNTTRNINTTVDRSRLTLLLGLTSSAAAAGCGSTYVGGASFEPGTAISPTEKAESGGEGEGGGGGSH